MAHVNIWNIRKGILMSNNSLQIKNLCKNYGKIKALDHITLSLCNGVYGLLGHNGAGKSTLLNILTCTLRYDEGSVLYNGTDILKLGKEYRDVLGFMPQAQQLYVDLTVEDFLCYIASLKKIDHSKEVIHSLLKKVNMYQYRKRSLKGLSGGMRQRVMIAQALLNDPKILLLDEPTAGLDPVERKNLRNIIASIAEDRIILLATHVISDVEFIASEIIMMKNGKVLTCSSQKELMQKTKVYESNLDMEQLLDRNPNLKVVNQTYVNNEIHTRFISDIPIGNIVSTTLDDVYLDWLE